MVNRVCWIVGAIIAGFGAVMGITMAIAALTPQTSLTEAGFRISVLLSLVGLVIMQFSKGSPRD